MKTRIYSVAGFAENDEIKKSVLSSDKIREAALAKCFKIPGFAHLALEQKNAIYDDVVKSLK